MENEALANVDKSSNSLVTVNHLHKGLIQYLHCQLYIRHNISSAQSNSPSLLGCLPKKPSVRRLPGLHSVAALRISSKDGFINMNMERVTNILHVAFKKCSYLVMGLELAKSAVIGSWLAESGYSLYCCFSVFGAYMSQCCRTKQ